MLADEDLQLQNSMLSLTTVMLQDRRVRSERVPISAKMADILERSGIDRVLTVNTFNVLDSLIFRWIMSMEQSHERRYPA